MFVPENFIDQRHDTAADNERRLVDSLREGAEHVFHVAHAVEQDRLLFVQRRRVRKSKIGQIRTHDDVADILDHLLEFHRGHQLETGHQPVQRHDHGAVIDRLTHLFFDLGFKLAGERRKVDQSFDQSAFEKRLFLDYLFYCVGNCQHNGSVLTDCIMFAPAAHNIVKHRREVYKIAPGLKLLQKK